MNQSKLSNFKIVFQLCKLCLKANPLYHVLNFVIWLIISIIPIFVGLLVKNLFSNITINYYMLNLFVLAVILIINVIITYIGGVFDSNSRFYIGNYLRINLLKYLLNNQDNISNSVKINLLNVDVDIIEEFISFTMDFINKLIYFIFAFIILAQINLVITFALFGFIFLSMIILYFLGEKVKTLYINSRNKDFENIDLINKVLNSHLLVKFIDFDDNVIKIVHKTYQDRNEINIHKHVFINFISTLTTLFNNLVYVVLMIGIILLVNINHRVENITIFIEYATYFIAYLVIFKEIFINFKSIQKFISDIITKFNISEDNILNIFKEENKAVLYKKFNVNKNINNKIVISKQLAHDYLSRLLYQTNYYGIALPKDYLLDDSIINNITLYETVDMDRLTKIINICEIDDLDCFSNKKIGVNGKKLSEGQRQRLIIARALYINSNLVILNNCFSNIDQARLIKIFNNLLVLNNFMIVVVYDGVDKNKVFNKYWDIYEK